MWSPTPPSGADVAQLRRARNDIHSVGWTSPNSSRRAVDFARCHCNGRYAFSARPFDGGKTRKPGREETEKTAKSGTGIITKRQKNFTSGSATAQQVIMRINQNQCNGFRSSSLKPRPFPRSFSLPSLFLSLSLPPPSFFCFILKLVFHPLCSGLFCISAQLIFQFVFFMSTRPVFPRLHPAFFSIVSFFWLFLPIHILERCVSIPHCVCPSCSCWHFCLFMWMYIFIVYYARVRICENCPAYFQNWLKQPLYIFKRRRLNGFELNFLTR